MAGPWHHNVINHNLRPLNGLLHQARIGGYPKRRAGVLARFMLPTHPPTYHVVHTYH